MKRICLIGSIAIVLAVMLAPALSAQDSPVNVAFSDPNRIGTLRVNMMSGNLTIKAYNGKEVVVQTKAAARSNRSRTAREAEAQGLRRIEAVSSGLSIEEENNVMTIGSSRFNDNELEIQVPAKTNLKLGLTNGDRLTVEGVEGEMELNNTNGHITLTDVAGSILAHSTNGNVKATVRRITPDKPMAFTSLNGNVDVSLPADTKANLKLRADQGEVYSDFEIQIKPSPATVSDNKRASDGRLRITVDKSIIGAINGGGPDFDIRTFNGNLYIRKNK